MKKILENLIGETKRLLVAVARRLPEIAALIVIDILLRIFGIG